MKRTLAFSAALVWLGLAALSAQDREAGMIRGEDWGLYVQAPEQWSLDRQTWASMGVYALFYPQGEAFSVNRPFIYISSTDLAVEGLESIADWAALTVVRNEARDPGLVHGSLQQVNHLGIPIPLLVMYKPATGFWERILYVKHQTKVHSVLLVARSLRDLWTHIPLQNRLVKSFVFFDDRPN